MTQRLLELLARVTIRHRVAVLAVLVAAVIALGSRIPNLKSDPSPNHLRAAYRGQDVIEAKLKQTFGDTDRIVLVLLEAPRILAPAPIQYLHRLSREAQKLEFVQRVDSITVTPLPHSGGPHDAPSRPADAGQVDSGPGAAADRADEQAADLEAAIAGDAPLPDSRNDEHDAPAELARRILPIVQGDGKHFPRGLRSLSDRARDEGLRGGPVVSKDDVTPAELASLEAALERSPLVRGRLISEDGTVAVVSIALDPSLDKHEDVARAVAQIDALISKHPPPAGVRVRTGGLPHLRQEIVAKMHHDQRVIMPGALLVCVVLLAMAFRWVPGVVLPIGSVTMTAVMLLGTMSLCGAQLNVINNILPTMLVVTTISDSIHLIARYRFEIQTTHDKAESGRRTVKALGAACFLTSLTTAIGFSSLAAASTPMLRQFGLLAAGGVMLAYLVTVLFLPSALMVVPAPRSRAVGETSGTVERFVVAVTRRIIKRPWPVVSGTGLLLGACAWGATQVPIDMRLLDMFDRTDQVYQASAILEDKLQGMRPLEIALRSPTEGRFADPEVIAALDAIENWASAQDGILGAFSYSNVLHEVSVLATGDPEMRTKPFRSREHVNALITVASAQRDANGALTGVGDLDNPRESPIARYLTADGRSARVTLMFGDVGASQSMRLIEALDRKLGEELGRFGDVDYDLTGEAYLGSFGIHAIVTDLFYGLLAATLVIFVILTLLFRSVTLGLVSIPPNVLPLAGTMGYMWLRGLNMTPANVIIFAISIGLAVSGSIHVIARYREELSRKLGAGFALVRAARSTGKAIVFTSFILSTGFSVLLMSSFVTIREFGELIAVTIAGCLVATVIVQPALLRLVANRSRGSLARSTRR